jgi:threonine aldolase
MQPDQRYIDLRSDTVTRPSAAMREAMCAAAVGDDVFGEDPTIRALEEEIAGLLGKEAALFTPSGTMANEIALLLHTRPGDAVLCEEDAHVQRFETGGPAALAGVQLDPLPLAERLSDAALAAHFRGEEVHAAPTVLLAVENTHNVGGGRALGRAEIGRITSTARALGLRCHCDGARLWNAAAATGDAEAALAAGFDTVSVCFSKGLGAPVGSALVGSRPLINRARTLRKRLGGGMRQAGILAAAALFAVRQNRVRLADDHRRAARLADGLARLSVPGHSVVLRVPEPITNMVYWMVPGLAGDDLRAALAARGLLMLHEGRGWLRAVTHLDVDDRDIDDALAIIRGVLEEQ